MCTIGVVTSFEDRIVADHRNLEDWINVRDGRIGGSDAAHFAKIESANSYVRTKLLPIWTGGRYADWGNTREPVILAEHGWEQNHFTVAHATQPRFIATPDAIDTSRNRLAQVKTTVKRFKTIPANYRRQVWWEQFVMGPEYTQTDFIFEHHHMVGDQFVPDFDSTVVVIDRDEEQIAKLVRIATEVLIQLDESKF